MVDLLPLHADLLLTSRCRYLSSRPVDALVHQIFVSGILRDENAQKVASGHTFCVSRSPVKAPPSDG